jgi:hypothetical protein
LVAHADTPYTVTLLPCQQAALPLQLFPNEVPGADIPDGQIDYAVAQGDQLALQRQGKLVHWRRKWR